MKRTALKATLLAAMTGLTAGEVGAADYKQNPFTLVYEGAIAKNEPGKVNIHPVTYKLNGLDISANVYTPANYERMQKGRHAPSFDGGKFSPVMDGPTHRFHEWVAEQMKA